MQIKKLLSIPNELVTDQEKLLLIKIQELSSLPGEINITLEHMRILLGWEKTKVKRVAKSLKVKNIIKTSSEEDSNLAYTIDNTRLREMFEYLDIKLPFEEDYSRKVRKQIKIKKEVEKQKLESGSKNIKVTRNVKLMINYWNQQSCLKPLRETKNRKSIVQTKRFKQAVQLCKKFLSGELYKVKESYFPEDVEPFEIKFTIEDFRLFVDRLVILITDKNFKPVNKKFLKENSTLISFFIGNQYGRFDSILLRYCLKEPKSIIKLENSEKDVNALKSSWKELNPNHVFSGKDILELDKFLNHAMLIIKNNQKFKPRIGTVASKIGDVIVETIQKNWGRNKVDTLRPSYLNTNHFKSNFESTLKRLGY